MVLNSFSSMKRAQPNAKASASAGLPPDTSAIGVGIAHVRHAGNQWREAAALLRLRRCQRQRAHSASMERAVERNDVLPLGVIARQLQRSFNGFSSGVAVVNLVRPFHGRDLRKTLAQGDHALVIEVGAGHVNQFGSLLLDGGDNFGMAMAGRGDGDAGGEVEKLVAVDVFHDDSRVRAWRPWDTSGCRTAKCSARQLRECDGRLDQAARS